MTDGPQQSPGTPETQPDASFPPPPQGPVLRYTPGQPPAAEAGRLSGGTQQAWSTPAAVPQPPSVALPPQSGLAPHPGPQQQWTGQPGMLQQGPLKSGVPAVLAFVVGIAGLIVPFLPVAMDDARLGGTLDLRAWIGLPFALVALALGIAACVGRRRMKALAIVGMVFAALTLVVVIIMIANRLT
ncbi:hypothetical protein ABZU76_25590 [Amycolatopsis sp. NPDC005232]|uniref:hypothetical protein n=1 Tax=Amycolatopsis sp. NPDC005232 TaxID=3157027 RepID=UPI0033B09EE2